MLYGQHLAKLEKNVLNKPSFTTNTLYSPVIFSNIQHILVTKDNYWASLIKIVEVFCIQTWNLHEEWGIILSRAMARSLIKSQNSQSGSAAAPVQGIWKSENSELKIWSSKQPSLCKPNVYFLLFLIFFCSSCRHKHYLILLHDIIKWSVGCVVV